MQEKDRDSKVDLTPEEIIELKELLDFIEDIGELRDLLDTLVIKYGNDIIEQNVYSYFAERKN